MTSRVPFDEIIAGLQARARDVAERYAPGGYVEGARYWALCPWRGDRKIGSFHVGISGPWAGRWREEATGERGDMLDLIQGACNLDRAGAIAEAKDFLGLGAGETPASRELRQRQARAMEAQRARDQAAAEARTEAMQRSAARIWEACGAIENTPAALYLAGRGITPEGLGGYYPPALRFHPGLEYRESRHAAPRIFPAMVAEIRGPREAGRPGAFYGIHRTWLGQDAAGRWTKAPVAKPKKVLGRKQGGAIRLWPGRGGRVEPGRIFITEGIEDGLSVAVLVPTARVIASVDLGNLLHIRLPQEVAHITHVRDNDPDARARDQAEAARVRWWNEDRRVSVWSNHDGGKDLNDALRAALAAEAEAQKECPAHASTNDPGG